MPEVKEAEEVVVALLEPEALAVDEEEVEDVAVPEEVAVVVAVGAGVPVLEGLEEAVFEPELLCDLEELDVAEGEAVAVEVELQLLDPEDVTF